MACSIAVRCPGLLGALLAGTLPALTGCDSGPRVHPVTGHVVIKGKGQVRDLAGYNVQFRSTTDPAEMPAGRVEEDGTFTLYTRVGGKAVAGAKEGTYRACLLPPVVEGGGSPPLVIPARYTKFESSNLEFKITPGPNHVKIEVERGTR